MDPFRKFIDIVCDQNASNIRVINLKKNNLINLYETNSITKYRINTFFDKEPETLDWINGFEKETVFWDIGANVGLYSIYAAKTRKSYVSAFEPSVFHLAFLSKNISVIKLENQINIIPVIISDKESIGLFSNSSVSNGAALSSLIQRADKKNSRISECKYRMPVFTLDSICTKFNLTNPKHLKIDVDGLEFNIIKGAKKTFKTLESLLIEVDLLQPNQELRISKFLKKEGFYLDNKHKKVDYAETVNQIWYKR